MQRLYLYLASRNKQGIKLLTILQGSEVVNSDVENLSEFNLPEVWEKQISRLIHENRILYTPRIESAKDFRELRSRLAHRGFTNLPMGVTPLLHFQAYGKAPMADTSSCKIHQTMIRKKKAY